MAGLSLTNRFVKRTFDIFFSAIGLLLFSWLIVFAYMVASLATGKNGFFIQTRVGKNGKLFKIIKIRTMYDNPAISTTVTTVNDSRITNWGLFFRKTKIDELPQLINVFLGHMSFVGPRPDVPGFADKLSGCDRIVLAVRPGITGPAALRYRNEEEELAKQKEPERYNREVIFPEKVKLNREYVESYSFTKDLIYILKTIFSL
jgi:lipopolysaccharide/colanic/teichoic acid biosynthesis glycosyltransferase